MATEQSRAILSVRGNASVTVAPDQAYLSSSVTALADSKAAAVELVSSQLAALTDDLGALGGVTLTAQTMRAPLAWAATSLNTHAEQEHDKATGQHGPTGRHQANLSINVSIRDFALLDRVSAIIATYDALETHGVQWLVDDDNAAWATVRADAIHAALRKGRDYAAALGGAVISVEHVADAGLLGGDSSSIHGGRRVAASAVAFGAAHGVPSLDPQPQDLTAVIEARFVTTVGALPT